MKDLSYALGMSMAANLASSGLKKIEVGDFVDGFSALFENKQPKMSPEEANQHIQAYFSKKQNEMGTENRQKGNAFLAENKKKASVTTLPSGLQYEIIKEGSGEKPKATDKVRCHYHGTLIDGSVFDSSIQRGQPAVFGVNQVIKGWVEALQLMPIGSKWRLFVPSELAYGEQGAGGSIEPNSTLIFEVELLGIE